ncbi:hypothetical protein PINS_up022534, partial [Pythium insidiosum]
EALGLKSGAVASTSLTSAVANDDALPDGWREAVDPASGDTYFWNENTKETSWERPASGEKTQPEEAADSKEEIQEVLQDGWEEVVDPQSNSTYYWHRETNETTWTRPVKQVVSLAKAREAKSRLDEILKFCGSSSTTKPAAKAESKENSVALSSRKRPLSPSKTDQENRKQRKSGPAT